ncbi:peptidase M50 [Kitasatospora sp. NPDC004669]|uniref:peptidase M50 n=1 Tax=Kitasatospora sp. NPDC004669 TaxID=3154555 RepID=UPI0033B96A86
MSANLLQARPRRRAEILVSGPLQRGPAQVHLVLDPNTGHQLELAPKVHFVLDLLDGRRTLGEIGEAYTARFGTLLGAPQWRQLLGLLYGRRLLDGPPAEPAPGPGPQPQPGPGPRPTLLDGRLRLAADTPALVARLHRATGPLRDRRVLAILVVLIAAMLADLARRLPELASGTAELAHRPLSLTAVLLAVWVSMALHEVAHALAGHAAGGTVTELGVRWRLPMAYLYCVVADVRFLPSRTRQLVTAGAGVLMNLALLLPVDLARLLLGDHPALDGLLLIGAAAGLVNLLPLPPLDGYRILEYLLGTTHLAAESRRFAMLAAARVVRCGSGVRAYPTRARLVFGGYALGWTLLTGALLLALAQVGWVLLVSAALLVVSPLLHLLNDRHHRKEGRS